MATSALNVFGLDWNPAADEATKQGYVQTLLGQGVTPDQLKAKIGELDPANANQAVYDLLGIPTGALPTAAATPTAAQSALSTVGAAIPTATQAVDPNVTALSTSNVDPLTLKAEEDERFNQLVDAYVLAETEKKVRRPLTDIEKTLFSEMFGAEDYRAKNQGGNLQNVLANPDYFRATGNILTSDMEKATLERYRNDPDYIKQAEDLYGRPLTAEEKASFGQFLFPTYESLNRQDKPRAIIDWVNQSLTGGDLQTRRQSLNQGLVTEYDALAQRFLNRSLMDSEKQEIAKFFNIQNVASPAERKAAEDAALGYIYDRSIADAKRQALIRDRNNRIQSLDASGNNSFVMDAWPISTGAMTYNAQVNAVNALRNYGVVSFDEIGIKAVPNPDDPNGAPLYQYYNKWDDSNIGGPTADGQLKIARDDRGIKGGTDVTMYYGQDGRVKLHGTEDASNLWDTAHSVFQNVVLGQLAGGIASGIGALAGIGGAGAGAAGATAAADLGGLSALGEGAGAAGAAGTAGASSALANTALRVGANALVQAAQGADPLTAIKNSVISAGTGMVADQFASMIPTEVANVGKNAVTQLISTGKIDPLSLATSAGVNAATDTLVTETGMDRTTAAKLVTAGVQLIRGNEVGALTSLGEAGLSQLTSGARTDTTSGALGRDVVDEYNVTGGGGAFISSGNPTEDEQIALAQLNRDATSLVSDYIAAGGSMEPTDLAAALSNLKDPYGRPLQTSEIDRLVGQAQTQLDTQTRNAKTQSDTLAVLSDYTGRDSDLSRENAYMRLVAAGNSGERADEILNSVDAQVEANRAARAATQVQNQAAINAGAGEFAGADARAAIAAGADEFTGADTAAAVNARIANATSFNDAYAIARQEFGPNSTFNYQGKLYSTATAEERPDLSAAGLAAKALSGDPQFQVALSEKAVQNQRDISQVFSDYSQKGGDLTREGALARLESLGVTKNQASFYLDQADGKLPLLYDQFKAKVPTGSEDSYRAYILAFNELKNKGAPTSLIDVSGYGASGARPNMPAAINAISTAFGMGAEAAGNALKAFGTVGESFGFNTAQMSDYGRRLENIAQELYPQALTVSEDEVKGRFANAKTPKELGQAVMDSVLNNPGALLKMGGVELIQEAPNIALALATGGTSALIRYGGMLAGLGLDVVESAGLQGAQKVDEGLAKGLTRAQAVKSAVDDMKAAGAVTAIMTAAADRVPFGGTVAKTLIKGSAGEGTEEYLIARATGQDHMSALRQAAFGALIGGPTEATLQGAGNLTNVTINGDTMIGTYADGTKVSISEPAGATDLKIDIIKPTDTSVNVSNALTADLSSGADLTTSINNVVSNNITADLSGTIDSTVKAVIDNGVDLSKGVTDLTSSAVTNTGDTTAVINNVVSSLASNGTDLNANAGSVVAGAVSGGATVTDAVDTTLKAVTANGGSVADSAASIVTTVSTQSGGDTTKVADATTAVVDAAITSGTNITTATSNAVDAALAASGGSTDVVSQVVGDIASKGNNDATAAAVASAVTNTSNTTAAVDAALSSGGDAGTVLSTASNAAVTAGTDAGTAVTDTLSSALSNNVDTKVAVDSTIKGALDAGADASVVVGSAITTSLDSGVDTTAAVTSVITSALNNNADTASVIDSTVTAAITSGADTGSVVDSTIKAAVTAGTDSTTAIDSTLTAVANAGGDVAQAVGSAVDASLAAGADTSQTLIGAVSTAIANGGDASTVVSSVVDSAVTNGTSLADASASSIATAIVSGANADTVIKAVTDSNSGLAVESGSEGGVTTVVASDGTSNTQVSMDANTQTVTTTTTDTSTGETKQVTISGDTTTTVTTNNSGVTTSVTVDESTGVKTEITSDAGSVTSITTDTTGSTTEIKSDVDTGVVTQIVSNPDRDQIVTTTWNADNTVTVTTKSGDGPETTETLTADVAPVQPQLDPIAAVVPVQAVQATKTTAPKAAAPKASFKLPSAAASGFGLSMPMASSDYDLGVLKSSGDTRIKNPLEALMERVEQMNQIDPTLAAVMSQRLGIQPQQAPTFTYGQETSIDDILGLREPKKPEMEEALYAEGGYVEPLRAKGGAMNLQFMDRGGALPGGREDFKGGKHVAGDGDGQSDDIPAWLADGEFVFPADVVSALGNGSTKAGTDKLYKMMHEIRARARSTKVKDLPPPAHKSPLDYIKKGK